MVAGVQTETTLFTSLANLYLWLSQNQGTEIEVPGSRLHVGLPITAPRAVICTVWLLDGTLDSTPLLAGRLRGVIHPRDGSVRLSFTGSAASSLAGTKRPVSSELVRGEGARVARQLLDLIAIGCERADRLLTA